MKIAVSSFSFRQALQAGELKLSQVPAACAVLGFEFVELNDVFLRRKGRTGRLLSTLGRGEAAPSTPDLSPVSLGALEKGLRAANVRLTCFTADNDFMPDNPPAQEEQIRYARAVIGAARYLECQMVRLWLTQNPARITDVAAPTLDAFRQITDTAARAGVRLALEHRFGRMEEIEAIVRIVEQVRSYHLGACLNFGHLPADAWQAALTRLAPYTIYTHARSRRFDKAGEEITIPYSNCIAALQRVGYQGFISIEYEGEDDPLDGIMATKALVERYKT
jgi:sugar phosphate isomerase/epimerase